MPVTKIRLLLVIITLAVVGIGAYFASLYARGYRFDLANFEFLPSGILVIKSDPEAASVYVNGELKTATNATISLSPGTYDVVVKKEGYFSWNKRLVIEKEVVTEANASLFKTAASLAPLTFSGAQNPKLSPDSTKVVYVVPPQGGTNDDKSGLWVMETVNLPLGFAKVPKRITDGVLTETMWVFSPSGREIMVTDKTSTYLLDTAVFTPQNQRINIASRKVSVLETWQTEQKTRLDAQMRNLPDELKDVLTRKTSAVVFSPDETKILYIASGEAKLKDNLIRQLPGSSTQKQERTISIGKTYVYDIKEDRNFLIDDNSPGLTIGGWETSGPSAKRSLSWFPTSSHIILAEEGKIVIMDYDGTNRQQVYAGSYVPPHAYPFAANNKLLILTNLGANSSWANLYSLTLK